MLVLIVVLEAVGALCVLNARGELDSPSRAETGQWCSLTGHLRFPLAVVLISFFCLICHIADILPTKGMA
ncbi:hypothetical protein [Streptomyces scopuliridis]|uniref:Uncharacterized protein n=1 Tax=Streptomyces scopuliridis TaxID=452529 RepID=A0ACD4ZIX6_9ACTN|nr:hypothetical protein [Streptomyces scopuliridis]WSB98405.1 hypothetical protein OG835_16145 [Streptomyces scopuliridis]